MVLPESGAKGLRSLFIDNDGCVVNRWRDHRACSPQLNLHAQMERKT